MKKIERFVVWEPSDEAKHCNHQAVISQKKCMVNIADINELEQHLQIMMRCSLLQKTYVNLLIMCALIYIISAAASFLMSLRFIHLAVK